MCVIQKSIRPHVGLPGCGPELECDPAYRWMGTALHGDRKSTGKPV